MGTTRSFGSIRKLPSDRFQARYRHLGRRVTADTTFTTKAAARVYLSSVETDLARGTYRDPQAGNLRFDAYSAWWLDQRNLRARTRETYDSQMKHILPTFATAMLGEISPHDVRSWHGQLGRSGLHVNSMSKVYRLFRSIMTSAVEDGLLPSIPVAIRGASKERIIERPLLTWDHVGALADAIDPRFKAFVWTAAASGLRFGELSGLTVGNFDVERCSITVSQALSSARLRAETRRAQVGERIPVGRRVAAHHRSGRRPHGALRGGHRTERADLHVDEVPAAHQPLLLEPLGSCPHHSRPRRDPLP